MITHFFLKSFIDKMIVYHFNLASVGAGVQLTEVRVPFAALSRGAKKKKEVRSAGFEPARAGTHRGLNPTP
jgi:hypothetical protein